MARNKQQRDMSNVVAVGEMEGHVVEVLSQRDGWITDYTYRVVKDGEVIHTAIMKAASIPEAINAAITYFYGEDEATESTGPTKDDFEALNALLFTGGLTDDLETLEEVGSQVAGMHNALQAIERVKTKAASDLADIEDYLASNSLMGSPMIDNLRSIASIFDSQCDVLIDIAGRNIMTMQSFLKQFMQ